VGRRLALLIATYEHQDEGLRRLVSPAHDAEALADVLRDPDIAGFEVTTLVNQPYHIVGQAIGDFFNGRRRDDLTLLYFTGHGLKDDAGRLYLAMINTRRDSLLFTALSAEQIDQAIESCASQQKILILDCCYSGAFPTGRAVKADPQVHALERFRGRGRTVLTASDSTQYSFEGNTLHGDAPRSVFTHHLVAGLREGDADLDGDGDITLDELYSYVHDHVVDEMPQQRPKKQTDVEGRIRIARNVNWSLPVYLRNSLNSPIATDRLSAVDALTHLHRIGNDMVGAAVRMELQRLVDDDSRAVSSAAQAQLTAIAAPVQSDTPMEAGTPEQPDAPEQPATSDKPEPRAQGFPQPEPEADEQSEPVATVSPGVPQTTGLSTPVRPEAVNRISVPLAGSEAAASTHGAAAKPRPPRTPLPTRRAVAVSVAAVAILATLVGVILVCTLGSDSGGGADQGSFAGVPRMLAAPDGKRVYISNRSSVAILDTSTNTISPSFPVGAASSPNGAAALSPDGSRLYLGTASSTVMTLDARTGAVQGTPIPVSGNPYHLAISPRGDRLYAVLNDGNVAVIDPAVGKLIGAVIPVGRYAMDVVVSPDGKRVYVSNERDATVSVIDTATQAVATKLSAGDDPAGLAMSSDGRRLYVGHHNSSETWVLDAATGRQVAAVDLGQSSPTALALKPDGKALYVANLGSDTVSIIDTADLKGGNVLVAAKVGDYPSALVVRPDGKRLYVLNTGDRTVSVIDTNGMKVVGAPIVVPN
jgi:YVTN family beta-propeller protein